MFCTVESHVSGPLSALFPLSTLDVGISGWKHDHHLQPNAILY